MDIYIIKGEGTMKLNIKVKLIIIIFSLSFLSTGIISFFGIQFSKGIISENSELKLNTIHSSNMIEIQNVISYTDFLLNTLEESLSNHIDESADINSSEFWNQTISNLENSYEHIGNMSVFSHTSYIFIDPKLTGNTHDLYFADMDNDGKVELQKSIPAEYFDEDTFDYPYYKSWWFQTQNTLRQTWSLPYDWTLDNNKTVKFISITRPIIIKDTFVGVIGTDIQYEKLINLLKESNYPGYNYLINSENQVLVHPYFKQNQFINYENEDIFFKIVDKEYDQIFTSLENGESSYMIISKLSNGWIMGTSVPESSIIRITKSNFFKVNTILAIILLLNIPISYKLATMVASPLIELSKNIDEYSFNHPKIISDKKILNRSDEIGTLAKSMNLMASNLFGNILTLKDQNEQLEKEIITKLQLKERLDLVNSVMENSHDGIFILNQSKELVFINKSLKLMLNTDEKYNNGRSFTLTFFNIEDQLLDNLISTQSIEFEHNYHVNEKENIFISVSLRVLNSSSEENPYSKYFMGIVKNISSEKKIEKDIDFIMKYDDLTGLANKEFYEEKALEFITSPENNDLRCAVITLNIVEFRIINEIFGYEAGNNLLLHVRDALLHEVKDQGIISRTNGDEFSIFIYDFKDLEYINSFIDNLYNIFNLPYPINNKDVYIQIYMGVSLLPYDASTFKELQSHSLSAINHVKEISKTGYEFYYDKMSQKNKDKYDRITNLKQSIQANNIINHYQPIFNIATNKIEGFESLVRINDEGKIIFPNDFISLAEETNLIIPLGKIVLSNSIEFLEELNSKSKFLYTVNINISYKQFETDDFVDFISEILKDKKTLAKQIVLELTEGTLIKNIEMSKEKIEQLESLGLTIAIDDFGTGYSALNYLKELDIKKLKIDRSFIKDYPDNDDGKLLKTIEHLANDLDIETVVEGIETKQQLEYIKSIGCLKYQGYYLSKPLSAVDILKII
jgi:diguanylate cyclase (GGDEF)-like protein